MALTKDDVAGIAEYARIALTEAELSDMTTYLNDAIDLLEPILGYDPDDVEPTFHPIGELANVARDDVPVAGLTLGEALANAASWRERSFLVPQILADGGAA